MGIASLGGILSGAGDVNTASTKWNNKQYSGLLNSYIGGLQSVVDAQGKYQPQLISQSLANLGTSAPGVAGILTGLMPQAQNLVRGANPQQTGLLDQLTNTAQQQLNAGASLDPALERVAQQSIRGGQAARGLGYGPADVLQESSALTSMGNDLRQQRQGFASNVAGMQNQFETQPTLQMLMQLLQGGGALNATATPSLVPSSVSSQLLTMPYMAKLQANQATAGNTTGLYQSMDSNSNSFISGL
jgi:hypothetical protein